MTDRRTVLTGLGAGWALAACTGAVLAAPQSGTGTREPIAILGTGRLGSVLGKRWCEAGHPVIYGSRTPEDPRVKAIVSSSGPQASSLLPKDAAHNAGVVVFALPWNPVKDLLPTLGDLTGKLIIDPMNFALQLVDGYPRAPEDPTSLAEQLQGLVPNAMVVKAFNAIAAKTILDPARLGGPVSIPLAGADRTAKVRVAALISEIGLQAVDTGPLPAARYLEDMLRVSVGYLIYSHGKSFEFYLRPVPS
jgi:8-hydroxy-5-deazaflavin:NADPH oxidoreductase